MSYFSGEKFLQESTEQKAGPKLAVGDACTCVAVNLGGLEGEYPDITERWMSREKELAQSIDWQSFKVTSDHVSDPTPFSLSLSLSFFLSLSCFLSPSFSFFLPLSHLSHCLCLFFPFLSLSLHMYLHLFLPSPLSLNSSHSLFLPHSFIFLDLPKYCRHVLILMLYTLPQICSWLRNSAEMFLQSRVELGSSLETAEDLLMEHQEFEIRAKVRSYDHHITLIYVIPHPSISVLPRKSNHYSLRLKRCLAGVILPPLSSTTERLTSKAFITTLRADFRLVGRFSMTLSPSTEMLTRYNNHVCMTNSTCVPELRIDHKFLY